VVGVVVGCSGSVALGCDGDDDGVSLDVVAVAVVVAGVDGVVGCASLVAATGSWAVSVVTSVTWVAAGGWGMGAGFIVATTGFTCTVDEAGRTTVVGLGGLAGWRRAWCRAMAAPPEGL